jgi:hypothetical protein
VDEVPLVFETVVIQQFAIQNEGLIDGDRESPPLTIPRLVSFEAGIAAGQVSRWPRTDLKTARGREKWQPFLFRPNCWLRRPGWQIATAALWAPAAAWQTITPAVLGSKAVAGLEKIMRLRNQTCCRGASMNPYANPVPQPALI